MVTLESIPLDSLIALYILIFLIIILICNIIQKIHILITKFRKSIQPEEYFFYKNSLIYKVSRGIFWISIFMLGIIFVIKLSLEKHEAISHYPGFDIYINIAVSIFAGIFVNTAFFYFTTFQDICVKDKNATKILKIIAQCCCIERQVVSNIRSNALCYSQINSVPNQDNTICPYFRGTSITPENLCRCSKFVLTDVICHSNQYFTRIIRLLQYNLNLAYSMSSQNKPSMMDYIEYMQTNLLKFETMLSQNPLLDICYLSSFEEIDSYFQDGMISETFKIAAMDFYRDIKEINRLYKNFKKDALIYSMQHTAPLELRILLAYVTRE